MKILSTLFRWPRAVRRQIRHLVNYFRDVSWKESPLLVILQVLLTAGPVTYIALHLGYYFGYGKAPPEGLFVHLFTFTIIGGTFAYIFGVVQRASFEPRAHQLETEIITCINQLTELVFDVRNHTLKLLDAPERDKVAALHILRNPFLNEPGIEVAVQILTGNRELAQAARRIEVFRRNGLYAAIDDAYAALEPGLAPVLAELETRAPEAVPLLEARLSHRKLRSQQNVERPEGFIERALLAAENSDADILGSSDAVHIYALLLELLSGRVLAYLQPHLVGHSELAQAQNELVKARARYRAARTRRNGTLRGLAEALWDDHIMANAPVEQVATACEQRLETLVAEAQRDLRQRKLSLDETAQLHDRINRLNLLYRKLWLRHQTTTKAGLQLLRQERRFARAYEKYGKGFCWEIVDRPALADGIYIDPMEIALSERERGELARRVVEAIRAEQGRVAVETGDLLTLRQHKLLAMRVAMELNRYLSLSDPGTQQAVEATTAPRVTALDTGMGGRQRASWAMSMVEEMEQDQQRAAHRMALSLVQAYGAPLSDEAIATLVKRYGADRAYLEGLRAQPHVLASLVSEQIMLKPHHKSLQILAEKTGRRLRGFERLTERLKMA